MSDRAERKIAESFENLLNTLMQDCCIPQQIKAHAKLGLDQTLKTANCKAVRDVVVGQVKEACKKDLKGVLNELEIQQKLSLRQDIIEDQENRKGTQGWRPSGDVDFDFYGDRRGTDLEHSKKLSQLCEDLELELRLKKQEYERLMSQLKDKLSRIGHDQ